MKDEASGLEVLLNSKTRLYRGFTILALPRKKPYCRQRYQITHNGNYLGIDFSLSDARETIDRIISQSCFIAL